MQVDVFFFLEWAKDPNIAFNCYDNMQIMWSNKTITVASTATPTKIRRIF